jgi:hypothetical protein
MKNLVFIFVTVLCALFMGCDNNADNPSQVLNTYDYIGEYDMQTQIVAIRADGSLDTMPNLVETPVSLYLKDNQLYVFTYHFGMPNLDREEPLALLKSPQKVASSDTDSTFIEDVPIEDQTSKIVLMNGLVYTLVNGAKVSSKPILVSKTNETALEFLPSETFKVLVVNITGTSIDTLYQHFEYQPIYKQGDFLQWDVDLIMEWDDPLHWDMASKIAIRGIKYHNILRKRE